VVKKTILCEAVLSFTVAAAILLGGNTDAQTKDVIDLGISVGAAVDSGQTLSEICSIADGKFIWPLDSSHTTTTSAFGLRYREDTETWENHNGVDFGAGANSPIYAVCGGEVTQAYYNESGGNVVTIKAEADGHTLEFTFMHNNSLAVNMGDKITQGQIIAYAGSTGDSTGVHCHLKLLVDGVSTNPLIYLYGSLSQVPVTDSAGNLTYMDITPNLGSWSVAAGTEWNTYIAIESGVAVKY
jgi:hypothetical protein